MNNPLISVILAIYNVEEYIEKCLNSIVNQTYKNLEIILVDDGSPDNCPRICDEWAEKDSRIKVIHKPNGGVSTARNTGIANSTGEYIGFVDPDDYVDKSYFEELYSAIADNDCDAAVCRLITVVDGKIINEQCSDEIMVLNQNQYWDQYFKYLYVENNQKSCSFINACCKLFKKSCYDKIVFPKGRVNEDTATAHMLVEQCEKIAFIDKPLYYYIIRTLSITHISDKETYFDLLEAKKERAEYFKNSPLDKELAKYAYIDYLDNIPVKYLTAKYTFNDNKTARKIRALYKEVYRQAKKLNAFDNEYDRDKNILYHSFYINEYLYRLVRKIKRILSK